MISPFDCSFVSSVRRVLAAVLKPSKHASSMACCVLLDMWHMLNWGAERYHRLALDARSERADNPVEMCACPGVQVGQGQRLALLRINRQIDDPRRGQTCRRVG